MFSATQNYTPRERRPIAIVAPTSEDYVAVVRRHRAAARELWKLEEDLISKKTDLDLAEEYRRKRVEEDEQAFRLLFAKQVDATTMDLHHFTVDEALRALDIFISGRQYHQELYIITGRGIHSRDGIPKIKIAILRRLQEWRIL